MFSAIRRHLSYANVAATLALLFSMTGGALAAKHYLINSTKQINPKVLKALKGSNGRSGSNGLNGSKGPTGPQGAKGEAGPNGKEGPAGKEGLAGRAGTTGATGPIGPSNVYQVNSQGGVLFGSMTLTLKVPPGSYSIAGKVVIGNHGATVSFSNCFLEPEQDTSSASPPVGGYATVSNLTTATFAAESTITYRCSGAGTEDFFDIQIVATQVGGIH
jgi:hypothetical protein